MKNKIMKVLSILSASFLLVGCSGDYEDTSAEYISQLEVRLGDLEAQLRTYENITNNDGVFLVNRINEITQTSMKANVAISMDDSIGSGVVFKAEYKNQSKGEFIFYILTNYHVIEDFVEGKSESFDIINYLGYAYKPEILAYDKSIDLALLSTVGIVDDFYVVNLSKSEVKNDQFVFAIGSPQGQLNALTVGKVIKSQIEGYVGDTYFTNLIYHTALVDSGNSGGALLDDKLEVIGINTIAPITGAGFPYQSVSGYALPYKVIEKFLIDKKYQRLVS
jgi:S1-C subfamily serine protease